MIFLGLLLSVSSVLATPHIRITGDYSTVTINNNYLTNVDKVANPTGHLNLSNLNIVGIKDGAFGNLRIRSLSLDNNKLAHLPPFAFRSLRDLESLSLANNELRNLSCVFGGLENLESLDISDNNIDHLAESSFYGLTNATRILADGNDFGTISPEQFTNSFTILRLCIVNGVVKSLQVHDDRSAEESADKCRIRIWRSSSDPVRINDEGITSFEKGWYRLHELSVTSLDFRGNEIAQITGEMLNDLPKELTAVNVARNKISRLENKNVTNHNLRLLDLSENGMRYIEPHALAGTKNLEILLSGNGVSPIRLIWPLHYYVGAKHVSGTEELHYIVNSD